MIKKHPCHLHKLFCYAVSIDGQDASYDNLSKRMNKYPTVLSLQSEDTEDSTLPKTTISAYQLRQLFKLKGGKEYAPIAKPILSEETKVDRIEWATTMKSETEDDELLYDFLDKKWFYTTSRRRKLKFLPRDETEL